MVNIRRIKNIYIFWFLFLFLFCFVLFFFGLLVSFIRSLHCGKSKLLPPHLACRFTGLHLGNHSYIKTERVHLLQLKSWFHFHLQPPAMPITRYITLERQLYITQSLILWKMPCVTYANVLLGELPTVRLMPVTWA